MDNALLQKLWDNVLEQDWDGIRGKTNAFIYDLPHVHNREELAKVFNAYVAGYLAGEEVTT